MNEQERAKCPVCNYTSVRIDADPTGNPFYRARMVCERGESCGWSSTDEWGDDE